MDRVKIRRIEVRDFIGIKEFALDAGKVNTLKGHLGSGKSSVIEALEKALTNKSRRTEIVRHGTDEATLYLQLDDGLEITRKIRENRSDYLKIKKTGEAVPQVESFLRRLVTGEIFKPLEFVQKTPEDQAKIILAMLEIPWTMADIQNWFGEIPEATYEAHILQILRQIEQTYYDRRQAINSEIKTLEAQVNGIKIDLPDNYDGERWRAEKVQEHYQRVAEATEINNKIETARGLIDGLEERIKTVYATIETEKAEARAKFERDRAEGREFVQFLDGKITDAQSSLLHVEETLRFNHQRLDRELEQQIQRLRDQTAEEKEKWANEALDEKERIKAKVTDWGKTKAAKQEALSGLDILQESAIAALDEKALQMIETEEARSGEARIAATCDLVDVAPLKAEADRVAEMQQYLHEWDRLNRIIRESLAPRQAESAELTARIEKARELPMQLLQTASVPIEGLSVDGEGRIRIGETLISDLSDGEKLELAFRVAKAQAGELKVICIDGIQAINPASREALEREMATDGFQYFVTSTEDSELTVEVKA